LCFADAGGQVSVNPATGQPDYSMQWAEYYRSLGMLREAEMIEQQAKAQKVVQFLFCYALIT
jgi:far upstream element-binding protein